jgi:hypothetical protein
MTPNNTSLNNNMANAVWITDTPINQGPIQCFIVYCPYFSIDLTLAACISHGVKISPTTTMGVASQKYPLLSALDRASLPTERHGGDA